MIVWLASYPRSGNTFTRSVFNHYFSVRSYSIYGDHRDIGANAELRKLVGHNESHSDLDLDQLRKSDELVLIKTHDCPSDYMSPSDSVVYIVRDGRDACISYLRYFHDVLDLPRVCLVDVIVGNVLFGFWGNHVLRWSQADIPNIYKFRFESITSDPDAYAEQLADIFKMKRSCQPFPDFAAFKSAAPNFFNDGMPGSYGKHFSDVELATYELYNGPAMQLSGYRLPALQNHEITAYAMFCGNMTSLKDTQRKYVELQKSIANLEAKHAELQETLEELES